METRSRAKRKRSSEQQKNVTVSTKATTPKRKKKAAKIAKDVASQQTSPVNNEEVRIHMISIPIEVIYALNCSSMQHFSVNDLNDIKAEVNEPSTNPTNNADSTLPQFLIENYEDSTANLIEQIVLKSPQETFAEQILSSIDASIDGVNSVSTPVKLEHDNSTLTTPNVNQEPMLNMLSIPADVLYMMNSRQVRNSQELEIPKVEFFEETIPCTSLDNISNVASKESPKVANPSQCLREPASATEEAILRSKSSSESIINPKANSPMISPTRQLTVSEDTTASSTSIDLNVERKLASSEQERPSSVREFDLESTSTCRSSIYFDHKTRLDADPTGTIIKDDCRSPTSTIIKDDCRSPTSTIIKDECRSPILEAHEDFLEHSINVTPRSRSNSLDYSDVSMNSVDNLPEDIPCSDDSETYSLSNSDKVSHSNSTPAYRIIGPFFSPNLPNKRRREIHPDLSSRENQFKRKKIQNSNHSERIIGKHMRFSVSPEKIEIEDASDSDYGWEDPAPPKPKAETQPKFTSDLDPSIKEKMQTFNRKLQSEFDLDDIEASRKELFEAIDESIVKESKRKLMELDRQIQKKSDDYVVQLFGTDNFDSWDDDPALSNVEVTAKLKPFKSFVPNDVSLLEKMRMTNVINATKFTRDSDGRFVFKGLIKKMETEFMGREMPTPLYESIKREKKMISDLVIKFLMPYYDSGRIQRFNVIAREISHKFYQTAADENVIQTFIDNLFLQSNN